MQTLHKRILSLHERFVSERTRVADVKPLPAFVHVPVSSRISGRIQPHATHVGLPSVHAEKPKKPSTSGQIPKPRIAALRLLRYFGNSSHRRFVNSSKGSNRSLAGNRQVLGYRSS